MMVERWLREVRAADSEQGVVSVVARNLEPLRSDDPRLSQCIPDCLKHADDIRAAASALAGGCVEWELHGNNEAPRQMLILLGLATDRIGQLETTGVLRRPGGFEPSPRAIPGAP